MGGGGGGWEAEGGVNHPWAQRNSHCVLSETQKQPQCTCQARTVAGSCLTPHAALFISAPQRHHMDRHEFTGSEKCCLYKQTWLSLALSLVCLDGARVWLSYQAIKWISVLTTLGWVLANPVTFLWRIIVKPHQVIISSYTYIFVTDRSRIFERQIIITLFVRIRLFIKAHPFFACSEMASSC